MNRLLVSFLALLVFVLPVATQAGAAHRHTQSVQQNASDGSLQLFTSAAAAQQHCPNDEVVWLNTRTGIYHEKGMRWYGNTRLGAYVCRREADQAGDRDTRNGQ